jgi:hypothetical protein
MYCSVKAVGVVDSEDVGFWYEVLELGRRTQRSRL